MDTPLVENVHLSGQGTALALGGSQLGGHQALVAPQVVVGVHQGLDGGAVSLLIQVGKKHSVS